MDQIQTGLLVAVLVAYVLYRQLRTRPMCSEKAYLLPAVLVGAGLLQGGLLDTAHPLVSALLLAAGLVSALGLGAVRATTVRVWRDEHGVLWRRGTAWTVVIWLASIAVRAGLIATGYALGVHGEAGGLLLFLGLTLLVQNVVVGWRAREITGTPSVSVVA
ncbi:hypothetical protein ACGFNU_28930 [Spirillospora sp. NPDC048911]|uniref:hypothetical protein n=1 Tax=Spirillospora sp. NPDC048911 TaxID=3364527 RepID=UPI0037136D2D